MSSLSKGTQPRISFQSRKTEKYRGPNQLPKSFQSGKSINKFHKEQSSAKEQIPPTNLPIPPTNLPGHLDVSPGTSDWTCAQQDLQSLGGGQLWTPGGHVKCHLQVAAEMLGKERPGRDVPPRCSR
jgi:hypothetical protein